MLRSTDYIPCLSGHECVAKNHDQSGRPKFRLKDVIVRCELTTFDSEETYPCVLNIGSADAEDTIEGFAQVFDIKK